ncbi:MAG: inositol monophosphatase family protein [Bacteroidetes bacterium]|nr:inositol monophosphatase family protein [Bacteroidota bacterium]
MDLQHLTQQTCRVAKEAGEFLRSEIQKLRSSDIELKSFNNFVTYVDRESESRIMDRLSKILPGSGFIAEESPGLQSKELTWVIDPLDGTTNYIHGVPLYCVSIALMQENRVVAGVVYEVNLDECFYTWENALSYKNGEPVRVSQTNKVSDSLFATGFPYHDYGRMEDYLDIFRHLMQHSRGIRRLGSAAADLAYVAAGRYDGFYEYGLSAWDVAAGVLLVKNAGGRVTDFSNGENYIFGKEIIATNNSIHDEFKNLFKQWKNVSN